MPAFAAIAVDKLARLLGSSKTPVIIDVRVESAIEADPRLVPTAVCRSHDDIEQWAPSYRGRAVAVYCQSGLKLSEGVAAWLRHAGAEAEIVEGGFEAWRAAGLPLVPISAIPARGNSGATLWVTRQRPKIDRIACPWLIRRFVDPSATFLFVAPAEVGAVADRFSATAFDVEGVHWSHRGELCTFDVMVEEFGLHTPAIDRLAAIVRGADTARPDLAPEVAGLHAISLGLSRLYQDDLEQLDAGMLLYDALYRWSRDAADETHNWPASSNKGRK
jgi:rhodanese-related sulfurtransferase